MLAFCSISALRRYPMSLVMTAVVVILSLSPLALPEVVTDVPFYDKWGHFLMYGVLSFVLWAEYVRAHRRPGWSAPCSLPAHSWPKLVLVGCAFPCLLGALMEVMQATCTTTRAGEWPDFWADVVGVVLGSALAISVFYLVRARRR